MKSSVSAVAVPTLFGLLSVVFKTLNGIVPFAIVEPERVNAEIRRSVPPAISGRKYLIMNFNVFFLRICRFFRTLPAIWRKCMLTHAWYKSNGMGVQKVYYVGPGVLRTKVNVRTILES